MNNQISEKSIPVLHGKKLAEKFNQDDLSNSISKFVEISSPEEIKHYSPCLFVFDVQLLKLAPFKQWSHYLENSISLSEQHLQLNTDLVLPSNFPKRETIKLLNFAAEQLLIKKLYHRANRSINFEHQRISELNEIAIALSKEKNLGKLLKKILQESQNFSNCDAVSLYLVDEQDEQQSSLVFKLSFNDTLNFKFTEYRIPLNNQSIAGYAALNNQEVTIDDAYNIPKSRPYQFDPSLDRQMNYRTISILAVPITNYQDEAIGVLEFINRKRQRSIKLTTTEITEKNVVPFDQNIIQLLCALASQAAISIEKTTLINNINNLFEGFVQASVTAIEQRDPTTSGHSFRVADLTTTLATRLVSSDQPDYRKIHYCEDAMREIRYASLLHDFGKVGVRENILVKAKKLPEHRLELLQYRFELEKERLKRKTLEQELHFHHNHSPMEEIERLHKQLKLQLNQLDQYFQAILEANEPTILHEGNFSHLKNLSKTPYKEIDGKTAYLISDKDFLALSVKKGSLTESERMGIQSHVLHTIKFLKQIPWTQDLSNIPTIAAAHHEKLNGQGYPYGLSSEEISIPSRMMTICDIFDALVATDRPYKNAISCENAINIIQAEADNGLLDPHLVKVFIDEKVFEVTTHKDYKPSMNIAEPFKQHHICNINLQTDQEKPEV